VASPQLAWIDLFKQGFRDGVVTACKRIIICLIVLCIITVTTIMVYMMKNKAERNKIVNPAQMENQ
jgi:flagellar basal body-associated protein FliL